MKPMKYWQPFFYIFTIHGIPFHIQDFSNSFLPLIWSWLWQNIFFGNTKPNTLSIANCYTLKKDIFPLDQCIGFTNAHAQFFSSVSPLKDCSLYWWYLGRGYFSTEKFLYFLKSQNTATSILMHIDPT